MRIARIILLLTGLALSFESYSTTYYAVCSCNWTGSSTWSTTQGGAGGSLPALVAGDILVISDFTVTVDAQITINPTITINLISNSATVSTILAFQTGQKLNLTSSSSVINLSKNNSSYLDPQIDPGGGGGNSNLINIGGNQVWDAGNGTITGTGQLNQGSTNGSLPITLASFSAHQDSDGIKIDWVTASEINFDFFSLERSSDGKLFGEITQVKGHGTTNEGHGYSYEDSNPIIGHSYYRLVSNDFDGYQETFKVISVEYHGEKKFTVSPNPSDGSSVKLNFNFENDSDAQVVIYDNLGYAIGTYRISGASSISFDNQLKSGVYLAKYTSESFTRTERFIVK
jgi:hypothetical protein